MVSYAEYTRDDVLNDTRFASLQALRAEETNFLVFPSAIEPWDYPTASMALGALWLGHQLHPDMIPEEEYVSEAQNFYRTFSALRSGRNCCWPIERYEAAGCVGVGAFLGGAAGMFRLPWAL